MHGVNAVDGGDDLGRDGTVGLSWHQYHRLEIMDVARFDFSAHKFDQRLPDMPAVLEDLVFDGR